MKHPHEISLHLKEQRMKKEADGNQCMFTQVDDINANLMELSTRLEQMPTAANMYDFKLSMVETSEKLDGNLKRCNDMINELKGVVSMARASFAERKDCDVNNSNNQKCCGVGKVNNNVNDTTLRLLASENALLRKSLEEASKELNAKKWWKFWE